MSIFPLYEPRAFVVSAPHMREEEVIDTSRRHCIAAYFLYVPELPSADVTFFE